MYSSLSETRLTKGGSAYSCCAQEGTYGGSCCGTYNGGGCCGAYYGGGDTISPSHAACGGACGGTGGGGGKLATCSATIAESWTTSSRPGHLLCLGQFHGRNNGRLLIVVLGDNVVQLDSRGRRHVLDLLVHILLGALFLLVLAVRRALARLEVPLAADRAMHLMLPLRKTR
jgi:hypothetical protein